MPRNRNSSEPPKVMTWPKALPILIIAGIFDLARIFFEFFWLLGPALAGVICLDKVSGVIGTVAGGLVCGAGATAVGYFGAPALTAFGIVMAIAVGLLGWMTVGLMLIMTNGRIFKENAGNAIWFGASLLISEIPIIGAIPGVTIATAKMYHTQIKKDKTEYAKWEKENADAQLQERNQRDAQIAEFMQARNAELAQAEI